MHKRPIRSALLAAAIALTAWPAVAADFLMTFYVRNETGRSDYLDGYDKVAGGTISIKDAALAPGAFLPWYGGDITSASLQVPGRNFAYSFDLGADLFPPLSNPNTSEPAITGLRLDAQGRPLRVDVPNTSFCASCTPLVDLGSYPGRDTTGYDYVRPYLEFIDDDTYSIVAQQDGYLNYAYLVPDPLIVFAGRWVFESGYIPNQLENERVVGLYTFSAVTAVPEPQGLALMLTGIAGLLMARRWRKPA
jgi:hypothetical protein